MFREHLDQREVSITHDLSKKINMKKHEKRGYFAGDHYISSKVEMRFNNTGGVI